MNKTVKLVLFLAIVSAISGLSIGLINSVTEPVIEQNAIKSEKEKLEIIYPGAEFIALDYEDADGVVLSIYGVKDKGYIVKATSKGYNSSTPIIALVGLDADGTVTNVIALEHAETSGVGSKCFEDENVQNLYIGKKLDEEVDVLSGATFTSNAMKTIIAKSFEAYKSVK